MLNATFSVIFQHHDLVFSRNPERRSGKMLLCVGFLPWSDTKWQGGVWALVKFKNRSCENYMSWVYIHRMRWRIFAPLLPTAAACSLAAAAVKSVQLAEEEKICSCQLRFMSGPDHCDCYVPALLAAPPRGWWRCRRRPHAYCSWHLGGKCVLTPQKTQQQQQPKLENKVDSNQGIIVLG